eukprot:COSAG01_NODE_3710_length_5770_cov_10.433962_11_plen_59_part_00
MICKQMVSGRLQQILEDDLMGHKFDNKDYMTYFTCAPTLAIMRAPPPLPPSLASVPIK